MREYLAKLREDKKLTKVEAAKLTNLGTSYYFAIEKGERQQDMAYSMMERLATAFDVSVQTIIDAEAKFKASIEESA